MSKENTAYKIITLNTNSETSIQPSQVIDINSYKSQKSSVGITDKSIVESSVLPRYRKGKPYVCTNNIRKGNVNHTQQKVLPIKQSDTVDNVFNALLNTGRHGLRNASIFALNIAVGRRPADILKIKVSDIYDFTTNNIKTKTTLRENKTGKSAQDMPINDMTRDILKQYFDTLKDKSPNAYFFPSQKVNTDGTQRPLNVSSLNEIYRENTEVVFKALGDESHTHMSSYECRKTYGYNLYKYCMENTNGMTQFGVHVLDYLQSLYNHSSRLITLRYIGAWDDLSLAMANQVAMQYTFSVEK